MVSCGHKKAVGIDIGTTNISAVVMDLETKKQLDTRCIANGFKIPSDELDISEQSAEQIVTSAVNLLDSVLESSDNVVSIGITGQMHGLVYVDKNGNAVSELINWQDKRADRIVNGKESCCEVIFGLTGEKISSGFALATHYYNTLFGNVPENTVSFCSIMDLLAMSLTNRKTPLVHSSVAASFGLFDEERLNFNFEATQKLGIPDSFLPEVTLENKLCGQYRGIPVSVAIGDNQASFLGTVKYPERAVLINIGTGSQISVMSGYREVGPSVELRPYINGKYLICGSALCGGFSYAILERFFRLCSANMGGNDSAQYELMNRLAEEAYNSGATPLTVDTAFRGTRQDPSKRGAILGINDRNFTPASLVLGFIHGICEELHGFYLDSGADNATEAVASGGGVRKNNVMQKVISDIFNMPLYVNSIKEEAASGAALFGALAAGWVKDSNELSEYITYEKEESTL